MITPLDIKNKEFKKSMMGYNTKDVNEYLEFINTDYEKLYRENVELKDKIGMLTDQIRQYNNLEETLKNTLVVAQSTADEVMDTARQRSTIIIDEAEMKAQAKINHALDEVKHIKVEYDQLKKEMFVFKARYESFIRSQLITLEDFYNDFEESSRHVSSLGFEEDDEEVEDFEEKDFREEKIDFVENFEQVDDIEEVEETNYTEKFVDDIDHLEAD